MAKAFKDTAVGKFLTENAPHLLDVIGDVFPPAQLISNLLTREAPGLTPEQKLEFEKCLREYEQNELKAYLADVANAREMNVNIQQSSNASWLAKNVSFLIDLVIVVCTIILVLLLYYKPIPDGNREIAYAVLGVLLTGLSTVLNFYRGSSKGSVDKNDILLKTLQNEKVNKG
ncbi:MAG: hypothetical protein PWR20_1218 [Bacteroidales bacterium]|nr:hypothetical protein [Bacteroidales bacterium]MDN5329382.1 hypothetical protein [Bacteroidales bacterium]